MSRALPAVLSGRGTGRGTSAGWVWVGWAAPLAGAGLLAYYGGGQIRPFPSPAVHRRLLLSPSPSPARGRTLCGRRDLSRRVATSPSSHSAHHLGSIEGISGGLQSGSRICPIGPPGHARAWCLSEWQYESMPQSAMAAQLLADFGPHPTAPSRRGWVQTLPPAPSAVVPLGMRRDFARRSRPRRRGIQREQVRLTGAAPCGRPEANGGKGTSAPAGGRPREGRRVAGEHQRTAAWEGQVGGEPTA